MGAVHVEDFRNEVPVQRMRNTMVVDTVDALVSELQGAAAGEDVDFMAGALKTGGQFRHVNCEAADRDRVQ